VRTGGWRGAERSWSSFGLISFHVLSMSLIELVFPQSCVHYVMSKVVRVYSKGVNSPATKCFPARECWMSLSHSRVIGFRCSIVQGPKDLSISYWLWVYTGPGERESFVISSKDLVRDGPLVVDNALMFCWRIFSLSDKCNV